MIPPAVSGYVELPEGWERVAGDGPGPFVTSEVFRAPDGREVRWRSRSHRKASAARRRAAAGGTSARSEPVWWRPRRREWWMAVLFMVGSTCFAAGGVAAQWSSAPASAIGVVFFVGSIFFTSAAYLQYAEAVNAERGLDPAEERRRWRPASWEPRRIDWLASLVQFVGTLFFNVTTFTGMKTGFTTHQVNARVWAPDAVGSIAFLVSSELAYAEVCHRWACWKRRSLSWRIVALNLAGSIAFGVSAIASFVEPASGEQVSTRIANGGTSLGGICFFVGALLLMPEAAAEEKSADATPPPRPEPSAAGPRPRPSPSSEPAR
jgi:hypothetical protein